MITLILINLFLSFWLGFYVNQYFNIKKNNKLVKTLKERYKVSDEALIDYTVNNFKL
jgi:hypothetical protein